METNTVNAIKNPGLTNELVAKALADPEQSETPEIPITLPSDNTVDLPGGYITLEGEVIRTAEVRELNGRDEEAISRASTVGRMLNLILSRGVVSIGGKKVDEGILDNLFSGDRDALMLGIYKATFGTPAELGAYCSGCDDFKEIGVDFDTDITTKVLADPIADRQFTVQGKSHEYTMVLPNGLVQKELNSANDKTLAELGSILLKETVVAIDGDTVYNKNVIENIGIKDRRLLTEAIAERNPGPRFDDIKVVCPDCESEVVVPSSLGGLFQFS